MLPSRRAILDPTTASSLRSSLAPWLSVRDGERAVAFYKSAFGATETYRLDIPDGSLIVRLAVDAAEFWISGDAPDPNRGATQEPEAVGGGTIRMILTVADPDAVFAQALTAGASQVFPVGEGHGWRLGRLADPFGLHWEIGRPLTTT